jgi:arylsulfatase A-like enzyme
MAVAVRVVLFFAVASVAVALPAAVRLAGAGWPGVGLATLASPFLVGFAFGLLAVFLLRFTGPALRTALGETKGRILSAWVAIAPAAAFLGVEANRHWAIRPADLATPYSLARNGLLVAAIAGLATLLAWWVGRTEGSRVSKPRAPLAVLSILAALTLVPRWLPASTAQDSRPPIVVLLIDALRADGLGVYGNPRPTSPVLDAFAREAVVFEQAIAPSTFTRTSVASLFTGQFPLRHGVYWGGRPNADGRASFHLLDDDHVTLAETLRARGYLTEAWVQNSQILGSAGFAQGFLQYRDQQGPLARLHRSLLPWLGGPGGRAPFFAYVHYIDLHDPYRPAPPNDTVFGETSEAYRGLDLADWGATLDAIRRGEVKLSAEQLAAQRRLYDGKIAEVDRGVGELFARLRQLGFYDRAVIAVIADHGDGFGEHGFVSHSTAPYDELLRVPFLLKLPGGRFAGQRIAEQVRLVDLFPTLVELTGARPDQEIDGCSLVPLLRGEARHSEACALAVSEIDEEGERPTLALRTGRWKFIDGRRGPELYDLEADPGERTNLALTSPETERFARLAAEFAARRGKARETTSENAALLDELKALGYLKR